VTLDELAQAPLHWGPFRAILVLYQRENTLNLNELNTPSELAAANAQPAHKVPASVVEELLFKLDGPEALEVVKAAVAQLACWHQQNATNADTAPEAHAWGVDEGRLHVALLALNEVTF